MGICSLSCFATQDRTDRDMRLSQIEEFHAQLESIDEPGGPDRPGGPGSRPSGYTCGDNISCGLGGENIVAAEENGCFGNALDRYDCDISDDDLLTASVVSRSVKGQGKNFI